MISALESGFAGTGSAQSSVSRMSGTTGSMTHGTGHTGRPEVKKRKRSPKRRCGSWCEFMSSKGKVYYFHIKKGTTQIQKWYHT